jgi:hypothetical protein
MGVSTSEVGYTWATTGMGDHEVYKGRGGIRGGGDIWGETFKICAEFM